ncbi:MAG: PQQ-binding-like beta-propeller repeat protein, partial [Actinobacteria bacterium]|nr:PQQ-binding-like beta-propeller repeat protein [Actinomycetota bacterium]
GGPGQPAPQAAAPTTAWRWTAPEPAGVGMPAADRDAVAVTFGHQHLVLLDGTGRRRWQADRLGLRDVAPGLTPQLVVAATDEGVAAFDRADGTLRWDARLGERANTPTLAGGRAVASTWEGSLVALDLVDGRVAWRAQLPGASIGPAAGDGATVAATWEGAGRSGAGVVAFDAASGRPKWAADLEPGGVSGPLVADGLVVVVAGDLSAHALSADSGLDRWRVETDGAGSPEVPPVSAGDGAVLVAHRLGGLVLVDTAAGRPLWQAEGDGAVVRGAPAAAGRAGPFALALDDGRLLLGGPGRDQRVVESPGRVSGLAVGPGGRLLVAGRDAPPNALAALDGW